MQNFEFAQICRENENVSILLLSLFLEVLSQLILPVEPIKT